MPDQQPDERAVLDSIAHSLDIGAFDAVLVLRALRVAVPFVLAERDAQRQPDERAILGADDAWRDAISDSVRDELLHALAEYFAERDAERDAERQPEPVPGGGQPDAERARAYLDAVRSGDTLEHGIALADSGAVVDQPEQPTEPEPGYDPATGVYTLSDDERRNCDAFINPASHAVNLERWADKYSDDQRYSALCRAYAAYLRARADSDGEQPGAHGGR